MKLGKYSIGTGDRFGLQGDLQLAADMKAKGQGAALDIDRENLPSPEQVLKWSSSHYVEALRHDQSCPDYDRNVRGLLYVGYKVAAGMGDDFQRVVVENKEIVAKYVSEKFYERHIKPLYL